MDPYTFSLVLGGAGLVAMAATGLSHGGAGHGHGSHPHGVTTHSRGDAHMHGTVSRALWSLASPRIIFSLLFGFGATGVFARAILGGPLLVLLAIVGAIVFDRVLMAPLWNFLFRFASAPALTLETSVMDEALAASGFDTNGQGLVAIEVDGQVVQCLGTLCDGDRAAQVHVHAGDRLRVEDVDATRNRCTVSYIGRSITG